MTTDYLDRAHGRYYPDTTRAAILAAWDPRMAAPELVPLSRWTRDESLLAAEAFRVVMVPCNLCGESVECHAQDALNAHCGCGKVTP